MMTHPILEDLNSRHTVKKYDASRKVPEADLAVLFEAMRLSASSINSQPWKFVVIESDEAKATTPFKFSEAKNLITKTEAFRMMLIPKTEVVNCG